MTDIYYVEDDETIARTVKEYLERRGYRVFVFFEIEQAKQALIKTPPALALIDRNMPDGSGDGLCRWIRANRKELPVIFLTVRGDACDVVCGLENGADDYVVKPFELEVLLSRIRALLRRAGDVSGNRLSCGRIALDREKCLVFCDSREVHVTPLEYQLLLSLLQNKGKTVTREKLLREIWDDNGNFVNNNTLTVAVKRLREKLHQPACIKTVRSIGYRMEEEL